LQALTQVVAALAGVAVVRHLPVSDFAIYAVALSVQSALAVLSDVGVTTLLLARAGEFHADLHRVAVLARTARAFRLRLLVGCLVIAAPLLWFSLGQSRPALPMWIVIFLVVCSIVTMQVASSLDGTLLLCLLKTERQQIGQLANAAARLAGFLTVLAAVPSYLIALGINLLGVGIQANLYRRDLQHALPPTRSESLEDHAAFRYFARSQFINAAYYAFSSQITLWIVGIVATTRVVAEVGALGRLSNIIVLAQAAVLGLVVPRLARYRDPRLFSLRFFQVVGMACLASLLLLGFAVVAPEALLWVIGPKYANLSPVLPLAIAAAVTYTLSITIFGLNSAKAWFEYNWVAVPLTLLTQAVSLKILDIATIRGALIFGWITVIPPLLVNAAISWNGLRRSIAAIPRPT